MADETQQDSVIDQFNGQNGNTENPDDNAENQMAIDENEDGDDDR